MKYYYGNSYKEAISNKPVEIKSVKMLRQYEDCYAFVIAEDEVNFDGDKEENEED